MDIEYLTECYIKAYEKAFEMSDDTNFAINVATVVITIVANQLRVQKDNITNSFAQLLNSIAMNNKKQAVKSATKSKKTPNDDEKCVK